MSFDIETFLDESGTKPKHEFILGTCCLKDLEKNAYYRYEFFDKHKMSRFITTSKFSGNRSFNTGFNVAYDLYMLPLVWHKNFSDYSKGTVYIAKYFRRNRIIKFIDISNFFRGSLKNVAKLFSLEKMNPPKYLGERKPETKKELNELANYCYHDSFITNKISEFWLEQFLKYQTGICLTPSQFSFRIFRTQFQKNSIYNNPQAYQLEVFRKGYHGGRTEALELGTINAKNITSYDFNSAYVYAMREHFIPIKPFKKIINPSIAKLKKFLPNKINCFAELTVNIKHKILGSIPYFKDNLKFPVGSFKTQVFTPELKYLLKEGYIKNIHSLQIAEGELELSDFAKWVWKNRQEQIEEIMNILFKGIGNFLYGKFAQMNEFYHRAKYFDYLQIPNINEFDIHTEKGCIHVKFYYNKAYVKQLKPSQYMSIPISAEITSFVRVYLLEQMIKYLPHLLYVDTDSLIIKNKKLPLSNQLGKFKIEAQGNEMKILKEKIYTISKNGRRTKRTTKGFPSYITVNNKKRFIKIKFTNDNHSQFNVKFKKLLSPKEAYIRRMNPYTPTTIPKSFTLTENTKRILLSEDFTQPIKTKPYVAETL
jgi:hypothetical protein